ncbi:hypothetical protein [Carnobacterium maltaromaticum]|uniref:hypothetical protein n=1 Tax=Carnobacterium maltaromaticum TaxID=2751 RepID=UPI00295E2B5F|nr:hypothetical protein [Carnobacterium maltaromaticum]
MNVFDDKVDLNYHTSGIYFIFEKKKLLYIGSGYYAKKDSPSKEQHLFKKIIQEFTLSDTGGSKRFRKYILGIITDQKDVENQQDAFNEYCRERIMTYFINCGNKVKRLETLKYIEADFINTLKPCLNKEITTHDLIAKKREKERNRATNKNIMGWINRGSDL